VLRNIGRYDDRSAAPTRFPDSGHPANCYLRVALRAQAPASLPAPSSRNTAGSWRSRRRSAVMRRSNRAWCPRTRGCRQPRSRAWPRDHRKRGLVLVIMGETRKPPRGEATGGRKAMLYRVASSGSMNANCVFLSCGAEPRPSGLVYDVRL
jgi:hypothetical protein